MNNKDQILLSIKSGILEVLQQPITKEIRLQVHNRIFPLSVSVGAFINLLLVTKKDWQQNPSYYSLQKTIGLNYKLL